MLHKIPVSPVLKRNHLSICNNMRKQLSIFILEYSLRTLSLSTLRTSLQLVQQLGVLDSKFHITVNVQDSIMHEMIAGMHVIYFNQIYFIIMSTLYTHLGKATCVINQTWLENVHHKCMNQVPHKNKNSKKITFMILKNIWFWQINLKSSKTEKQTKKGKYWQHNKILTCLCTNPCR